MGFRNKFGMTRGLVGMTSLLCHVELDYATRAFALRKLFNAALACLGHQHPTYGCKDLLMGFRNEFGMTGLCHVDGNTVSC